MWSSLAPLILWDNRATIFNHAQHEFFSHMYTDFVRAILTLSTVLNQDHLACEPMMDFILASVLCPLYLSICKS